jgi:uncharacterized membrane protein YphA (DoxX/SURF4 family)
MNSTTTSTSLPLIDDRSAKPVARYAIHAARILLGLVFFVLGLNGFLNFIPPPTTPMPERAMAFFVGLMGAGYMIPLIGGTQVIVGALLLLNRFVPLALVVIAPVIVNIVAFHVFLEPSGTVIALVVLALESFLLWQHRSAFRAILTPRA